MKQKPSLAEITGVEVGPVPDPDVELMLGEAGPRGRRATRRTLHTIFTHDPRWSGRIRLDSFRNLLLLDGRVLQDADLTRMSCWIEEVYQAAPGRDLVYEVAFCVGEECAIHPVRDWLARLVWDGVERCPLLLTDYLGVEPVALHMEMGRAFMVGAVARIMTPGCKLDTVLVLIGRQGMGKSRFCRALVPVSAWFGDTAIDLRSKDAYLALQGKWIYELAEMESVRGRAATRVKSFLSSSTDSYRAPYARSTQDHPRQCIFVGTSNHTDLFDDGTGSRRFWPVEIQQVDVAGVVRDREQLWAEAVERFRREEKWHLDSSLEADRQRLSARYRMTDPHRERLEAWLEQARGTFTTSDAISSGLGIPAERIDRSMQTRIGPLLHELGCLKVRIREAGRREWRWLPPRGGEE